MDRLEQNQQPTRAELIAPHGLGFGGGTISLQSQLEQGVIAPETPRYIHEFLANDPAAFKLVEADDDGCGDGRPWQTITREYVDDAHTVQTQQFHRSLLRAKVFGGGLVVAASMWRAINGTPRANQTLGQDRHLMAEALQAHGLVYGAHSDDHASGEACGCGAIDNYAQVTADAINYREQITNTLRLLYGSQFDDNQAAIERVFQIDEALGQQGGYYRDASGQQSLRQILATGAVVKQLSGGHAEAAIVMNEVAGTTLDQQYFTETVTAMGQAATPQAVQVFSVDVWRGQQIAQLVAQVAHANKPDIAVETAYLVAYADFLIRTLAVAGTLTAGDLPVYRRLG